MNDPDTRDVHDVRDPLGWIREVLDLQRHLGAPISEANAERTLQSWGDLYREATDAPDTHSRGSLMVPPFSCPDDVPGERKANR